MEPIVPIPHMGELILADEGNCPIPAFFAIVILLSLPKFPLIKTMSSSNPYSDTNNTPNGNLNPHRTELKASQNTACEP